MALFRIYPEKDSTIWSEPTSAGLYGNAGLDEILNIEKISNNINNSISILVEKKLDLFSSTVNNTK